MNQESFEVSPAARRRLDGYLDRVERLLMESGVEREQRRSIVDDVEAQALEMLQERTAKAQEADMQAILGRLDPPEDYARAAADRGAEAAGQPSERSAPEPAAAPPVGSVRSDSPRLSPLALIGALMLLPILVFSPMAFGAGMLFIGPRAGLFRLPLVGQWSLFAPVPLFILMCLFGILAINQIRHGGGRFYGMGLAVFDALLLPLLLFDWVALSFMRSRTFYYSFPNWYALPSLSGLALAAFILALDCLIVWWAWKRLNQPPAVAQPGGGLWQSNIDIP